MHVRDVFLARLKEDLVGPLSENEVLDARPSDVYLTGILWPQDTRVDAEEDERLEISGIEESETNGGGEAEAVSFGNQSRPCTAGVSFCARAQEGSPELKIKVQFAIYKPVVAVVDDESKSEADTMGDGAKRRKTKWQRCAYDIVKERVVLEDNPNSPFIDLEPDGAPRGVKLHLRIAHTRDDTLATVTLLNKSKPDEKKTRQGSEPLTLFQVSVTVYPLSGTEFVARPSRRAILGEDDRSAALLYRNTKEFATGHTCSATWDKGSVRNTASMVGTSWIPTARVPTFNSDGHKEFKVLRSMPQCKPLSAQWLATANQDELGDALQQLPARYKAWIDKKEKEVPMLSLSRSLLKQAKKNISDCRRAYYRISEGAKNIANDAVMLRAFRMANLAMDLQYSWTHERSKQGSLEWRPFQLGFILLAATSVVDREHSDREIMDLLWFPTGGGKTEAYLALVAFLAFYRRLSFEGDPDMGAGVAVIMRYTLRLLTTQQFMRAASVILACEVIRRGHIPEADVSYQELGNTPFSIGLWIGQNAVPNEVAKAASALVNEIPSQPTPKQLLECPACQNQLTWAHDEQVGAVFVRCENEECQLFSSEAPLPVWTVDENVYQKCPTLLIGTVDKFAQIVRRKEIKNLFGLKNGRPPDLIIQDELHLISGPLGTVAGLYEAAVDRLFTSEGNSPKIVGSTATIRRAPDQVLALFNRKRTEQFPPSCLDADDSAFAVEDRGSHGRLYVGLTTAGRSAKSTFQAVAASLLQSGEGVEPQEGTDPYWTLVSYFNVLRELGGALVLMQDNVNDSLERFAERRGEKRRHPRILEELTSRCTQAEVRDMLRRLGVPKGTQGALDIVLATNMFSVGVDIPRLGLMLINGQPKGTAEYIQATSRVGRGDVAGLIVAVLNSAKARDRSHYESFPSWHETLYRDVEPTSVTPFAPRARDRALHAVLVTLVRHLVCGMLESPELNDKATEAAMDLISDIVERAMAIEPDEKFAVERELEDRLAVWEQKGPKDYWDWQSRSSLLQDAENAARRRAVGRSPGEPWPTLNSMRSVEVSTRFRLAEALGTRITEGGSDG